MSIRQALLALLQQGPKYGFQLRAEFETRTGSTWPLNIGQVYTTLGRLERDDLVEPAGQDAEGHIYYRLTHGGRGEVQRWLQSPVDRGAPARDELAIKIALAAALPGVDARGIVRVQRLHTLRVLQNYTRLKAQASADEDLAWLLVLDSLVFQAEAEVRWLELCEQRLARRAQAVETAGAAAAPAPVPAEQAEPGRVGG
ncbi:PadR family transcriptional regulator [Crossiella sp. CA198]|uniref:PadR family transcriptional regulator n=1 Tax=Crossiella sp. CA198 TaxID=3455607 RepID=UPI003F8D5487